MKTFEIPVWEKVTIWKQCTITLDAESKEDLFRVIQEGTLYTEYEWTDITTVEYNFDTEETQDWDYSDVTLEDIEEIL